MNGWFESLLSQPAFQFIHENNMALLAPEFIILTALLFSLFSALSRDEQDRQDTWVLALVGIVIAFSCLIAHYFFFYIPDPNAAPGFVDPGRSVFMGMFQADLFSFLIRTLLVLGTGLVILFSRRYVDTRSREVPGEYYVALLSALLGGMFLSGASDLIMIFVALETLGISSYILVGYIRGDMRSAEASLKYLVYGGATTAVILFGFSLLYGLTGGRTNLMEIAAMIPHISQGFQPLIPLMVVMILAGVGFKLSAAPFHVWAPDVYEGAPTPVTAFLSVVSKTAGFALAVRLFYVVLGSLEPWFGIFATLSVLSMIVGNFVALTQKNVKRLLAYSTIAHAGYLLMGLLVMTETGVGSLLYYLVVYLFMNLGAFAVAVHFSNQTGTDEISAYAGLVRKRPLLTLAFSFFLLSLAGIPITAGFFAKFFLFQSVVMAGSQYLWLVIVALLASTVSLYYYLNIIRLMVIAEPSAQVNALPEMEPLTVPGLMPIRLALAVTLVGTLALGFLADPMLRFCNKSVEPLSVMRTMPTLPMLSAR